MNNKHSNRIEFKKTKQKDNLEKIVQMLKSEMSYFNYPVIPVSSIQLKKKTDFFMNNTKSTCIICKSELKHYFVRDTYYKNINAIMPVIIEKEIRPICLFCLSKIIEIHIKRLKSAPRVVLNDLIKSFNKCIDVFQTQGMLPKQEGDALNKLYWEK